MKSISNQRREGALLENQGGRIAQTKAFTLIELFIVICVIAMLLATISTTFSGSRTGSQSFRCLNNNRQLCAAWRMYADDNSDRLVYSSDDGVANNPNNRFAWTLSHLDYSPNNPGNWDTNIDIVVRPLWPYSGNDATIYRCPSDASYVVVANVIKPRVRTFSLNLFLGGFAADRSSPAGSPGNAGGLLYTAPLRIFSKTTDLTAPGPANTFVFFDMRPEVINWGNFYADMTGYPNQPAAYQFNVDFPSIFHNVGASISFADGRAEIHRWLDPRTAPPLNTNYVPSIQPSPNNPDVAWLQAHATALK
jgi:type II secretory pathway pseudopilin PulG